jgi:hypothetical protein
MQYLIRLASRLGAFGLEQLAERLATEASFPPSTPDCGPSPANAGERDPVEQCRQQESGACCVMEKLSTA